MTMKELMRVSIGDLFLCSSRSEGYVKYYLVLETKWPEVVLKFGVLPMSAVRNETVAVMELSKLSHDEYETCEFGKDTEMLSRILGSHIMKLNLFEMNEGLDKEKCICSYNLLSGDKMLCDGTYIYMLDDKENITEYQVTGMVTSGAELMLLLVETESRLTRKMSAYHVNEMSYCFYDLAVRARHLETYGLS